MEGMTIIRGKERRRKRAGEAGGSCTTLQKKYEGLKRGREDFKMVKIKTRAEEEKKKKKVEEKQNKEDGERQVMKMEEEKEKEEEREVVGMKNG
jgi:hypothetical protein